MDKEADEQQHINWSFHGYKAPSGNELVQEWFAALEDDERDEVTDTVAYLQVRPLRLWAKPEYVPLGDGLSEIRCKVNKLNRTLRIYGFFYPAGRHLYTFLLGKEKKVKNDRDGISEAKKRKGRIDRKEASTHVFKFTA